ncbi:MAG: tRNA pseudouridine(38-40) synthase TruA [Deltaproteobacteria bacterium]|nr:tRNA pseudouridine(38-40) synthase TruA [Deltaproteobacteria bacterium]
MYGIILEVAYDGTDFCGFQLQNNGPTIQGIVEEKLSQMEGRFIRVKGASRTDSGVHARGQRIFYTTPHVIPDKGYLRGLNSLLPSSVSIKSVKRTTPDFNPRKTQGKLYSYSILNRPVHNPFYSRFQWQYLKKLDISLMNQAGKIIEGTHDFKTFQASDCERENSTRTMFMVKTVENNGIITIFVSGNAFLKNMVRIITGTLVDIGRGHIPLSDLSSIIEARDRKVGGMTAPPHGLCLEKVVYPDEDNSTLYFPSSVD